MFAGTKMACGCQIRLQMESCLAPPSLGMSALGFLSLSVNVISHAQDPDVWEGPRHGRSRTQHSGIVVFAHRKLNLRKREVSHGE